MEEQRSPASKKEHKSNILGFFAVAILLIAALLYAWQAGIFNPSVEKQGILDQGSFVFSVPQGWKAPDGIVYFGPLIYSLEDASVTLLLPPPGLEQYTPGTATLSPNGDVLALLLLGGASPNSRETKLVLYPLPNGGDTTVIAEGKNTFFTPVVWSQDAQTLAYATASIVQQAPSIDGGIPEGALNVGNPIDGTIPAQPEIPEEQTSPQQNIDAFVYFKDSGTERIGEGVPIGFSSNKDAVLVIRDEGLGKIALPSKTVENFSILGEISYTGINPTIKVSPNGNYLVVANGNYVYVASINWETNEITTIDMLEITANGVSFDSQTGNLILTTNEAEAGVYTFSLESGVVQEDFRLLPLPRPANFIGWIQFLKQ